MRRDSFQRKTVVGLFLLIAVSLVFPAALRAQKEELTLENAIGIQGGLLEASVAFMQGKVTFVKENATDPDAIEQRFNELGEVFNTQQRSVYEKYNTTSADYLTFASKNSVSLQDYLATHDDARERLNGLKARMDALISDLEALMQGKSKN